MYFVKTVAVDSGHHVLDMARADLGLDSTSPDMLPSFVPH